ncbi:peptidoglycan DD-metalloendopeptidase family protein [Acetatifactor muris]|uniref:AmiB activator n=1 Tax=Acetatifactor muris TaxID=879566 RepID=A0A2K4ZM71_9FIRM|nr:M23 family metallopeptidase [Acetatifactor muris]MCR2049822.1 peptidoglycan DD-metalloendopeptidase family protein [Acetatifactor muris]SOY31587.1 AmiB activator [Acetatifactor muris]
MGRNRHKRKNSHVVIVTSDAADGRMKQFRIRPWILQVIIIILCVIIGALIGYFSYKKDIWTAKLQQTTEQNEVIAVLEQEKADLEAQIAGLNEEIAGLNEKIQILSETVSQKVQTETALSEQLEKEYLPTRLPLSERATMEDMAEGELMCVFAAAPNSMVVATASGTVTAVNEDAEYGNNVWIEHGNGYTTIYRNQGEVKVKVGETVTQGTTLFLITEESSKLGYQMMKDGEYVNPMDMLNISG